MVGPSHHSGRCYNMWLCHGGVRRFEALMAGTSPEKGGRSHGSKIGAPKKAGRCLQHPWPAPATGHVAWHGVACCAVPCMAAVLVSSDCCEDGACQLHACCVWCMFSDVACMLCMLDGMLPVGTCMSGMGTLLYVGQLGWVQCLPSTSPCSVHYRTLRWHTKTSSIWSSRRSRSCKPACWHHKYRHGL